MTIHELLVFGLAALELASAQPVPSHSPRTDAGRRVLNLYWNYG